MNLGRLRCSNVRNVGRGSSSPGTRTLANGTGGQGKKMPARPRSGRVISRRKTMPPDQQPQGSIRCVLVIDGQECEVGIDFANGQDFSPTDVSGPDEENRVPTLKSIEDQATFEIKRPTRTWKRAYWRPRYRRKIQVLRFWALRGKKYFKIKRSIFW